MKQRVKIPLLGLMIYFTRLLLGGIVFAISSSTRISTSLISSIELFGITISLIFALSLVYKGDVENHKRTGWEMGITWYLILILMELFFVVILFESTIVLWYPTIFSYFYVAAIPIFIGSLLGDPKIKE